MKSVITLFLVLLNFILSAQHNSKVVFVDSTLQAIPFVSIKVANKIFTSNLAGEIDKNIILNNTIVINHIAYRTDTIQYTSTKDTIKLKPNPVKLREVEISSKNKLKTREIGYHNNNTIFPQTLTLNNYISKICVFISNPDTLKNFLISEILTVFDNLNEKAACNVFILEVNDSLNPGKVIMNRKLSPNQNKIIETSILKDNIGLSKSGVFVGITYLNKNSISPTIKMTSKKQGKHSYIYRNREWVLWEGGENYETNARIGLRLIELK